MTNCTSNCLYFDAALGQILRQGEQQQKLISPNCAQVLFPGPVKGLEMSIECLCLIYQIHTYTLDRYCLKVYTPQVWQDQPRQKKTEVASLTNETKNRVKNTRWRSHRVFFTRFFVEFGGKPPKFFLPRLILPHEVSINTLGLEILRLCPSPLTG